MRGNWSYKWEQRESIAGRRDISLGKDYFKGKDIAAYLHCDKNGEIERNV